jgi:hypothetical protein
VISPDRPRLLLLNRWDDEFAEYHRHFDHEAFRVAYVTTPAGMSRLALNLTEHVECVDSLANFELLEEAAARCVARLGGVDRIVALSEFDLLSAARLRERFGAEGMDVARTLAVVDKTVMKNKVLARGLRAPAFAPADDEAAVRRVVAEAGFPLIFKPRHGAASIGVRRLDSRAELEAALATSEPARSEIEEFVEGDILHVDGFLVGGRPMFLTVSRYVNTCYGFTQGTPLGSVLLDPSPRRAEISDFALQCLAALQFEEGVFHLELISEPDGRLCFLEIGARLGGGEIPFVMYEVFGLDLAREWLRIQLGLPIREEWPADLTGAGFLLVPEPRALPCVVESRPSMLGRVPYLYAEVVPDPGDLFDGKGGYSHIGGRFRFRGGSEEEIAAAIHQVMREYTLTCRPTTVAAGGSSTSGEQK